MNQCVENDEKCISASNILIDDVKDGLLSQAYDTSFESSQKIIDRSFFRFHLFYRLTSRSPSHNEPFGEVPYVKTRSLLMERFRGQRKISFIARYCDRGFYFSRVCQA